MGAAEIGLTYCIIGAIDRKKIPEKLNIPEKYEILHIIAIGKTGEKIILEDMEKDDSVKYRRDRRSSTHHIPKRALDDVVVCVRRRMII